MVLVSARVESGCNFLTGFVRLFQLQANYFFEKDKLFVCCYLHGTAIPSSLVRQISGSVNSFSFFSVSVKHDGSTLSNRDLT